MKLLLIITALLEVSAGLGLLVIPEVAVSMLLGGSLDTPAGLAAGRLAGTALIALAIACWQVRYEERGGPAIGVVQAMLFYNFVAAMVLVYAGIRLGLSSPLLWPAIVLHVCMGVWCFVNLWFTRRKLSESELTS